MTGVLFLAFLLQGIPLPATAGGVIEGQVRNENGTPASGVRVAALTQDDQATDPSAAAALVSLAETDINGRFALENVPPGRYRILAGLLEAPTYFPGTTERAEGRIIQITSGERVQGIDFTLKTALRIETSSWTIPVEVRVENASRFPVFANGVFPTLTLQPLPGGPITAVSLLSSDIAPPGAPGQYRVGVQGLPSGYTVKSMTFGNVNLGSAALQITSDHLPAMSGLVYRNGTLDTTRSARASSTVVITVVANTTSPPNVRSPRVTGRIPAPEIRAIHMSGLAGTLYSDGAFEFEGVPPGRHVIAATYASSGFTNPVAAGVIVGDQDIHEVRLAPVSLLSEDPTVVQTSTRKDELQDSRIASVTVRGVVRSQATKQPVTGGTISVKGYGRLLVPIDRAGRFEIKDLLWGSYELELSIFDHFTYNSTLVVGTQDLELELDLRRVY